MPIYAYRCGACGFEKDVLQKMSDDPLTICPSCGKDAYAKRVTAAGFQLKGSGWYVTDFRGGSSGKAAPSAAGESASGSGASTSGASTSAASSAPAAAPVLPASSGNKE
ncbi:MAG: zinc ribbon domain-containing protein [Limnobacter sp.]|nr:zinc ribbon domain-containing protein [Limnobacter sp.]